MPTRKSSGRKYSKKAGKMVEREMHEMKRGKLKSGSSGKKVKSRKQAIAIGLSEARRSGAHASLQSPRGVSDAGEPRWGATNRDRSPRRSR